MRSPAARTSRKRGKNIEVSQLNLEVTRNTVMPSLDLSAGYTSEGTGGTLYDRNHSLIATGGYADALRGISSLDTPSWSMSLNFTYPVGMTQAKANLARAELQLEQQQEQVKATELTIQTEVTQAGLNVQNTYEQLQAARKAREVAERKAEAEQIKLDIGLSNHYNVAQAQSSLTSARLSELNRTIAFVNAVAEFDRVQRVGR